MSSTQTVRTRLLIAGVVLALAAVAAIAFGSLAASLALPAVGRESAPPASVPTSDGPVSPFDDENPAIAHLQPELRAALQKAASVARDEDVQIVVNSGWRASEEQARLFAEAVVTYGSPAEAAKWVAPPERSAHVSGEAVDVGDLDAAFWLGDNGQEFGLCRTYENERWHFEFRAEAIDGACPPAYVDASDDPRMR